ncbi:DNA gyrase subunit A [hydrothermal vent metagenome]|uniref:DNA topoisomerase (ATP-hydrolyzing) n=1 Tax=hydrothermal vent metagenome TaxID=652676 RepID=A0A3B0VPE5_9ZZZZ
MIEETEEKELTISIEKELQSSYLDYAMSVIIGRALPDVRDGLKPVHRRALFAMRELGTFHNRPFVKSARIVGDVIGKYHPHGDTAAYDTIVRMAQKFSMRYILVDGQGNFGSVDGDSPAAMRYTEARMTKLDQEIIADLDKETVDFVPNYDNSLTEPLIFPTKIPLLLVNGSAGIAVGMATNIPPHNLTEVMNGLVATLANPNITVHEIMEHITGPDFPTGAYICGRGGIRSAFETGRGSVLIRSKTHIEQNKKTKRESIIVDEIPYQQNKATLIIKIASLIKEKRIEDISEVRDESDRHGMRMVMDLKKDANAEVVLNQLYKLTPLQRSFGIIMLSIVNNKPEILNIKQILEHFILHRKTIVYRRTEYDLNKAQERAHILEGLKIAINNLDEAVEIIKKSASPAEAAASLIVRFSLSEIQAKSILEMRLQRLTGLERDKIIHEYEELQKKITYFKEILSDENLVIKIIRDEFIEIRDTYGDERRTEIISIPDEILPEDLITKEDMVVTVTHKGYIKRNSIELYRAQHRGGKGVAGTNISDDDFVANIYLPSTHDTFMFFTNLGKVFWRKVYQIPIAGRTAKGKAIVNFLELSAGEKVAAVMPVESFEVEEGKERFIMMISKHGVVKKTRIQEFNKPRRGGKIALTIKENDEIIYAVLTSGNDDIILITRNGKACRFNEGDIRPTGRIAAGVRGIRLDADDTVIGTVVINNESSILTVTENGFGKRSSAEDYPLRHRGGKGVIAIKTSARNGKVIAALQVNDEDEIMMITNGGKIIRIRMDNMRVIGRNTQGVKMFNLNDDEKVVAVDLLASQTSSSDEEEDDVS